MVKNISMNEFTFFPCFFFFHCSSAAFLPSTIAFFYCISSIFKQSVRSLLGILLQRFDEVTFDNTKLVTERDILKMKLARMEAAAAARTNNQTTSECRKPDPVDSYPYVSLNPDLFFTFLNWPDPVGQIHTIFFSDLGCPHKQVDDAGRPQTGSRRRLSFFLSSNLDAVLAYSRLTRIRVCNF